MGTREDALALADELEAFEGYTCERCAAYEQPECRVYIPCTETVAKYCARRIREAVERDGEGATTVSAYDLLSEDEREAIAWVREHGGLGAVEKRLMPEGMEWPKVDGKPVDFKTVYGPSLGVLDAVSIYNNMACEVMGHDGIIKPASEIHAVVLAADGESLEVGQTVYAPHYDYVKCTVLAIEWVVDGYLVEVENEGGHKFRQTPDEFTHQRPVLDADGEPIKEGDTVYLLPGEWCGRFPCLWFYGGEELNVLDLNPKYGDIGSIKCCKAGNMTRLCYPKPSQLTHERPVLDADGNRIEPAMDVWWICEGDELGIHAEKLHVESIGEDGFVECSPFNGGTWVELDSTELYVHKPVPDADGEPIREGDTVYVLGFGEPLTVKGFADDGRVLMSFHGENSLGYKPSKLTHEQPVLDADGELCREGDEVWEVRSHRLRKIVGTHYLDYETGEPLILCDGDDAIPIPATCVTHTKPEPPDSRQAVVNEIGDEMAARIDILVSSGRWSDAD